MAEISTSFKLEDTRGGPMATLVNGKALGT